MLQPDLWSDWAGTRLYVHFVESTGFYLGNIPVVLKRKPRGVETASKLDNTKKEEDKKTPTTEPRSH